jgi:SAM-dependent methyltransferase
MLAYLLKKNRQKQTLSSFDFQWRCLPEGDAMLSDPWFEEHVCDILQEITGVSGEWFRGKNVLDAGCGCGRWSAGLLRLGARVTAIDFSEAGLERTRATCTGSGQIETLRVNLLGIPGALLDRRFDMVFSFGVLHHTGDTLQALRNVADLVADQGLIFLYLYGKKSWGLAQRLSVNWTRFRLAGLAFEQKIEELRRIYPDKDPHQCFDLLSPTINDRLTFDEVRDELEALGFVGATQTVRSGEVYLRAHRPGFSDLKHLRAEQVTKSSFVSHYEEVDRIHRDKAYEQLYCDLAARALNGDGTSPSLDSICSKMGISINAFDGKKVLLICHDSVAPAVALAESGAQVTYLTSPAQAARQSNGKFKAVAGTALDEHSASDDRYDFILALGAAVSITRNPALAVKRLGSRLAPGGALIIEALSPEPETTTHILRRAALKPFAFEKKIEILLRLNPKRGLAGAFALLSSRLPLRLSRTDCVRLLENAGLQEIACVATDREIVARARRPYHEALIL